MLEKQIGFIKESHAFCSGVLCPEKMSFLSSVSFVILCCALSMVAAGQLLSHPYGQTPEGQVYLITLQRGPIRMDLINWGARIISLSLPDATGKEADVVLGLDSFDDYKNSTDDPYFGAIVGRVANRIANGTFVLDGIRYNLSRNEGNNTLHGGKVGFDKVLWQVEKVVSEGDPSVTFGYHSFDGEEGFPGSLKVTVTYTLLNETDLAVEMIAKPGNKSTPVNLAQHTYWNLGGHNSGSILNNMIQIWGDKVTEVDKELIPTGKMVDVEGTPYDLRKEKRIGKGIEELKEGYDINYELAGGKVIEVSKKDNMKRELKLAARVHDPSSHRALEVYTNKPGLQFYTGNQLNGTKGKDGAVYGPHSGLCLETQGFPDAVNHPNFPSVIVNPGDTYHHSMLYRFFLWHAH